MQVEAEGHGVTSVTSVPARRAKYHKECVVVLLEVP